MKITEIISNQSQYHDIDIACSRLNSTIKYVEHLLKILSKIDDRSVRITQCQFIDTVIYDLRQTIIYNSIDHCIKLNKPYSLKVADTLRSNFETMIELRKSIL